MIFERLALFKPFGIFTIAVRNNCPWHRKSFTPNKFPFHFEKKFKKPSVAYKIQTEGGRRMIMRRILMDDYYIGWNHKTQTPEKRLSTPL